MMINNEDKKSILQFLNIADSWITGCPCSTLEQTWKLNIDNQQGKEAHTTAKMDSISQKIAQCKRCPLSKTRTLPVPGEGSSKPLVLVIGEAPDAEEDVQGKPFAGHSGQLLAKMLIAIDLSKNTNTYLTNIVKCRPDHNREPLPEESQACQSFLDLQMQILKPKIILILGQASTHLMLNTKESLDTIHGKFFEYKGIPLLPTYHPKTLLSNEALKRPAWEDLKIFRTKLNELLKAEGV